MLVGRFHDLSQSNPVHARYLNKLRASASLLALTLAVGLPNAARAEDWTGAVNADWFNAGNWSTATVPTAGSNVVIDKTAPNVTAVIGGNAVAHDLTVGQGATGWLAIQNGGTVTSEYGYIASNAGSIGDVIVNGGGATWTDNHELIVGEGGNGTLKVVNGAKGSSTAITIGASTGSKGLVILDGANSSWTGSGNSIVGYSGDGTLQIGNGATISNIDGKIGALAGSTGTATVDGAGSKWINSGTLYVGYDSTGSLTISKGGKVSSAIATIASGAGSIGTVKVDGVNSTWTNSGELTVGWMGTGSLAISNGGTVSDTTGAIGSQAGSTSAVTVDGAGSKWTNSSQLYVGATGKGTLTIQNGGTVTDTVATIGSVGSSTGVVAVDGAGSTWTTSGGLAVGDQGTGTLAITNGGAVSNDYSHVGSAMGATGHVSVTDAASIWTNKSALRVGGSGTGSLVIANGGKVSSGTGYIGEGAGSAGTVTVDGTNSSWTSAGTITVGQFGNGTLLLSNGATVSNVNGTIGGFAGSTGAAQIGAGAAWINSGSLNIGNVGNGALSIFNGGSVSDVNGLIGVLSGSTGTASVGGAGSKWTNSGNFAVGRFGTGDLTIWNGGAVSDVNGYVGHKAGSTGTATVDGAGSSWANSDSLYIGVDGTGTLTVLNGGHVASHADGVVGFTAGSSGVVRVDGAGSNWASAGNLTVGQDGAGSLTISNGGAASDADGYIGRNAGSVGTSTVDGAGAIWTNTGHLDIGPAGMGTLTISNGGVVKSAGDVVIADGAGSTGTLNIGAAAGQAPAGAGALSASLVSFGAGTGAINFNHTDPTYTFAPAVQGVGTINQLAGNTILTANSGGFTGTTNVKGGRLSVDGTLGGSTFVQNGGALGGKGTLTGDVSVASSGILLGVQGQTLTTGNLALASGSNVNVALGAPGNVTGLFKVGGNLTLAGTLNVTDAGGFGQGVYRIFDYSGALTDNGMTVGILPIGTGIIQTAMANQVNLVVGGGGPVPAVQFWNGTTTVADGTIHGGNGIWSAGPATNWTDVNGATAAPWSGSFAVFQNNPGTITVDASAGTVSTTGMQFIGTGWTVAGDPIALGGAGGNTTLRVGDGTLGGAAYSATIGSELTGNSRLVKDDLGTLILTGASGYTGGTTIAAGTLQIGNGSMVGSIAGDVLNNGTLAFNRSDATSFGGLISGSGSVRLMAGDLTLTASNSYTGGTDIVAGSTLRLGNGGKTGSLIGNVANNGTLAFNRSNALVFAGTISGNGTLLQIGSGTTMLTGDSSTFTGTTRVETGVLSVNGKLGGTLTVLAGGQLQGVGTVGDVSAAGTIAPGNSIGTLTVGNITFQAGSIYQVEVNAGGQSDKIVATGTATLNGGSVQVLAGQGSYQANTTYTILTAAGGRTGTFTGVTSNLAFLAPSLSYDPDNVYLTLSRNMVSFPSIGGTFNQRQAGAGVESLSQGNPIWNAVVQMDAPTAQAAFNQLSGEVHASAKTALYEDSRLVRDGALNRLRQAFGGGVVAPSTAQVASVDDACSGETCQADPTTGIAAWAQGFGSWGYTSSDGNAAGLSRSTGGVLVGVDAPVFEVARLGLFGGYSHTNFNVADRQSSGGSDNVHLGAYGGAQWGPIGIRAGLVYTWHNLSTSRSVAFPGFADSLRATYGAGTFQVFGEAGYRFEVGQASFEPFANIAYMSLSTKGFSETGGAAALTSTGLTNNVTATTVGLRAGSAFVAAGLAGQARGTVGWQHAFTDTTPWANLQLAGGTPFTVNGVPIAKDAALLELGLDLRLSERASVGLGYTGQFASGAQDQSVRAAFNYKF